MESRSPDLGSAANATASLSGGRVEAHYKALGSRTGVARVREGGSLRIRHPNGLSCQGVLINTAGGIVDGDKLSVRVSLDATSDVLVTTAAAEKVYRSDETRTSFVDAHLRLAHDSRLLWLPQETILFEAGRLRRRFAVDLAETAELVAAELLVFGRRAYGEGEINGALHDSWRVRRGGRLVFADETRIEGAIGRRLARGAVAGGHHAVALLLVAGPRAAGLLEPVRATIESATRAEESAACEGGASLKDGIVVARLLASSAERLRRTVAATLAAIDVTLPRVWQQDFA